MLYFVSGGLPPNEESAGQKNEKSFAGKFSSEGLFFYSKCVPSCCRDLKRGRGDLLLTVIARSASVRLYRS